MAFKNWMDEIAEKHDKEVVLPGMEPAGRRFSDYELWK